MRFYQKFDLGSGATGAEYLVPFGSVRIFDSGKKVWFFTGEYIKGVGRKSLFIHEYKDECRVEYKFNLDTRKFGSNMDGDNTFEYESISGWGKNRKEAMRCLRESLWMIRKFVKVTSGLKAKRDLPVKESK